MKKLLFQLFWLLLFIIPCQAQIFSGLSSLESAIDAEQVAMGESFVAYRTGLTSFKHNPATLTGINFPTVYYSNRDNEIHNAFGDSYFYEFGVTFKSPIGVSNINYARFNAIEADYLDMNGINQGKLIIYDHIASLHHGYQVNNALSVGLALKWVDLDWQVSEGDINDFSYSSTAAIVGDIGATYQLTGLFQYKNIKDSLVLGISLQNFGSDLKYNSSLGVGTENETVYQTPRFLKFGFSYGFTAFSQNRLPVFEYILTAQYGRLLNPKDYDEGNADTGGIGSKVRFWEVLELNIGGLYQSSYSFYANEDVFNMRYGFAINLPFERFGWNAPITAKFSYTHIPVNQAAFIFDEMEKRVSVITGQISYNVDVF
jgi:hypothetical protein